MTRAILKLPPNREPKQVTVKHKIVTLGEHKEAFLNANNPHGFLKDEDPEDPNSLSAIMRQLSQREFITKRDGKIFAEQVRKFLDTSFSTRHTDSYDISARRAWIVESKDNQSILVWFAPDDEESDDDYIVHESEHNLIPNIGLCKCLYYIQPSSALIAVEEFVLTDFTPGNAMPPSYLSSLTG